VTAEFNRNLLRRINRELEGNFDLECFQHEACYNRNLARIEMSLVSCCDQAVTVGGREFEFAAGEAIHTESSHKYTIEGFSEMAAAAGLTLRRQWTDDERLFAVLHFAVCN
jgi:uncharacterized SAM-dependent methyltransferase